MKIKSADYYWYHLGVVPYEECDKINEMLEKHNWEGFKKMKEKYDGFSYKLDAKNMSIKLNNKPGAEFPQVIFVEYVREDASVYGFPDVLPLNEETINIITNAECERG